MEDLKIYLGPTPEVKQLPDGTYEDVNILNILNKILTSNCIILRFLLM